MTRRLVLYEDRHWRVLRPLTDLTPVPALAFGASDLARRWLEPDANRWVLLCSGYDFHQGLASIGPNVRSMPKAFEPEELEALLTEIEASIRTSEG